MTINDAMVALVAELAEGEVPDALAQRFCLSSVWADLARLAGEPLPAAVAAAVADVLDATCEPLPVLPPFARANFADAWLPLD